MLKPRAIQSKISWR